jgi:deoxyribodipyrimidine photo-lyase
MESINIFWFRRDLRVEDNHGLFQALNAGLPVLPLFIFDPEILALFPNSNDARLTFIHGSLKDLDAKFRAHNSSLLIYCSSPEVVFGQLTSKYSVHSVYCNTDYEPAAIARDQRIADLLSGKGIDFYGYKDQIIFHQDEISKKNGKPYTVFTPYSKKWNVKLENEPIQFFESERLLFMLKHIQSDYFPELEEIGYQSQDIQFPEKTLDSNLIEKYARRRDFPAQNGTSRLGIHLRFGTVSIRKLTLFAQVHSDVYLNELIWRNFYMDILWHFPHVADRSFKPAYDSIAWRNNEEEFERWCSGQTGYPLVDAGMRELNETGYMHNRVRMVVASFLTKHLLVDWRWGEAYFASKLLDYELASNNGGWQWASGSGCDAAPYFRVFSPDLQTKKFDPKLQYIRKWVPELDSPTYPKPMIDHTFARSRAIETYRKALK